MDALLIHKITADSANTSITYACWYVRNHPDPGSELLKHAHSNQMSIKNGFFKVENSWNRLWIQEMIS